MKATLEGAPTADGERTAAERIAAKLARVPAVVAVHADDSPGMTRIWTVLVEDDDAALDAVFQRELELHDDYGERLASVEFHVVSQEVARSLALGDRIYERARR